MISFFIPIRKNSKRIKNKNINRIGHFRYGLTEIKIAQLKKVRVLFNKKLKLKVEFIISTDSQEIKKFVHKFKWIKIHHRTKELAADDCMDKLIKEVPKICSGEYILWTHVTSPCFDHKCYEKLILKYLSSKKNYDSAFSADLIGTFIINDSFKWVSHNYNKKKWPRTQDLKDHFSVNNAAFIAKKSVYIKNNDRLCKRPLPHVTEKGKGFDIDTEEDLIFYKKNFFRPKVKSFYK